MLMVMIIIMVLMLCSEGSFCWCWPAHCTRGCCIPNFIRMLPSTVVYVWSCAYWCVRMRVGVREIIV